MPTLKYTGHPFVDVGVATITAFSKKLHPEEVTDEDLEQVADFIEWNYVRPPLRGHLTMAFTSNGWFIQPAFDPERPGLSPEKKKELKATRTQWAFRHLRQWQPTTIPSAEQCIFTGDPALATNLSDSLQEGRVGRSQMPLLQGDVSINFFAAGDPGLPISGLALLALQFFPLGCAKCGVGLLAAHSDNERLNYQITNRFFQHNIKALAEVQAAGGEKFPKAPQSLKTLLVDTLLEIERDRSDAEQDEEPASLTAYNFNNGKTPDVALYHLRLEVMSFLLAAQNTMYQGAWGQLAKRGWQLPRPKKGKGEQTDIEGVQESRRNYLYEDLFDLPREAKRFIRTYFLRVPKRTSFEEDPRRKYSLRSEQQLVSWPLVELFLRSVVHMEQDRIAGIRTLGDNLAVYIRKQGGQGKRFFRDFFTEQRPSYFRERLIKANIAHIKDGYPPLFDMGSYIDVFEEGDEVMRSDWRLARDLVYMRMIDQLKDWIAQNPEALPEPEPEGEAILTRAPEE